MLRLHKRTRYALNAAMGLAHATEDNPVTAHQIAERCGIPAAVLAKVLQQLVREGVAVGTRGAAGGYRLARKPSELTVLQVITAFEPPRESGHCLLHDQRDGGSPDHTECSLCKLFEEVDEQARYTFASITLETLVRQPRPDMGSEVSRIPD